MAFVITPEAPLALWLASLRAQSEKAPGFFAGRPVIVDCALLKGDTEGAGTLLRDLEALGLGVIDVENAGAIPGADPWKRPLTGGRPGGLVEIKAKEPPKAESAPGASGQGTPGLIVEDNVRSGQSVLFPKGDVTVLGSVSSGAEVLAGGSIHIYGALRGRALAGAQGFAKARIFCRRLEAELVSIDGFYQTAEDMDAALRGGAAHIWLEAGRIMIAAQR